MNRILKMEHLYEGLEKVFKLPIQHFLIRQLNAHTIYTSVHNPEGTIVLRFEHMPILASLFQTEKLDFRPEEADKVIDSYTFQNGIVLFIAARYDEKIRLI